MKIAVLKERRADDPRVAATPETVKRLVGLAGEVCVEQGAGLAAGLSDQAYQDAGAKLAKSVKDALSGAELVLKVRAPLAKGEGRVDELAAIEKGAALVGMLDPYDNREAMDAYAAAGIDAFAMELLPRISRAQSMDVLSSQANLAGYRAVIDAAATFERAFPLLMTAAGTVPPAKALVMGAGVAGLQAIATARRLGAVVSATDVRPAVKEQVESLGAAFVAVEDEEFQQAETSAGYAREMSDAYKAKQAELIAQTIAKQDIVICTALIPGRPAPVLVTEQMVETMKPGSVIVDLAVERGGNCPLSKADEIVDHGGVKIVAYANMAARVGATASALYAKNLLNFVTLLIDGEAKALKVDWDDEIVAGSGLTRDGAVVHAAFTSAPPEAAAADSDADADAEKAAAG